MIELRVRNGKAEVPIKCRCGQTRNLTIGLPIPEAFNIKHISLQFERITKEKIERKIKELKIRILNHIKNLKPNETVSAEKLQDALHVNRFQDLVDALHELEDEKRITGRIRGC